MGAKLSYYQAKQAQAPLRHLFYGSIYYSYPHPIDHARKQISPIHLGKLNGNILRAKNTKARALLGIINEKRVNSNKILSGPTQTPRLNNATYCANP